MRHLRPRDFIVAIKQAEGIEENSVGVIRGIDGDVADVFFIGVKKHVSVSVESVKFLDVEKTGKPRGGGKSYPQKICNLCHMLKNNSEFQRNQNDAKGRHTTRPSCRECRKGMDGVSLSKTEREKMDRGGPQKMDVFTCPICEKTTIVGITSSLVRDHDHNTGMGRTWICDSCNTGLGRFRDDKRYFERILAYLTFKVRTDTD